MIVSLFGRVPWKVTPMVIALILNQTAILTLAGVILTLKGVILTLTGVVLTLTGVVLTLIGAGRPQ